VIAGWPAFALLIAVKLLSGLPERRHDARPAADDRPACRPDPARPAPDAEDAPRPARPAADSGTAAREGAAVTRLVLGPLGMTGSSFPAGWPYEDPDAVTGYELEPDGTFVPDLDDLTAILLAAGLWTTAADLVRFGTGWSSLLPAGLASEALRPRTAAATISRLGWRLNLADGMAWEAGDGPGGSASLIVGLSDNHAYIALTNRKVPIMGLNRKVFRQGS
jgi:Beta-lactamase